MSKIGKINIPIPDKVKVLLSGNTVNVEGPLGKQAIKLDLDGAYIPAFNKNFKHLSFNTKKSFLIITKVNPAGPIFF